MVVRTYTLNFLTRWHPPRVHATQNIWIASLSLNDFESEKVSVPIVVAHGHSNIAWINKAYYDLAQHFVIVIMWDHNLHVKLVSECFYRVCEISEMTNPMPLTIVNASSHFFMRYVMDKVCVHIIYAILKRDIFSL